MTSRKRFIIFVIIFSAVAIAPLAFRFPTKLTYNPSPSAPIGFYWIDAAGSLKRGAYTVVPTPSDFRILAADRRYLPLNVPLIKRVVGLPGDLICRLETDVFINGRLVATAMIFDNQGRALPVWQGCITLKNDQFFALMDAKDSFDGRYFGPLNQSDIIGVAKPLYVWIGNDD